MATRLYLSGAAAPYAPATIRGAWDDTAGAVAARALLPSRADGGITTTVARAETNAAANFDVLLGRWVSGPLGAQTLSGTVQLCVGANESNAAADFAFHVHVYVTQGDSDTPRGDLLTDYVETTAQEWGTSNVGRSLASAQAIASLGVSAGDRIVVEIGYVALNAVATSYTGTLRYGTQVDNGSSAEDMAGDLTAGGSSTTLAPWVEFSGTFSEDAAGTAAKFTQVGSQVLDEAAALAGKFTQVGAMVLTGVPINGRFSQVGLLVLCGASPEIAPEVGSSFGPLVWAEFDGPDGTAVFAQVDLPDPAWYYAGYKAGKLLATGTVRRSLSDEQGEYPGQRFDVTVGDFDRFFRGLVGSGVQLLNRRVVVRMIDEPSWRERLTPRTVAIGLVRNYKTE